MGLILLLLAGALAAQEVGYDTLVQRLENRDPKIRREAARMLGDMGDRRAVPPLGKLVKDLDEETRFRAVEALASLVDRQAIPFFAEATRDPSRRVKKTAIEGMVTLYIATEGPGGLKGLFTRAVDFFRRSSQDLIVPPGTEVDPRVVEALAGAVSDPDGETAGHAARALGTLRGREGVPAMADALPRAPKDAKLEILRAFQKIRDPRPVPDVVRLLSSSDKEVRAQAAYTLGLLGARDQSGALRKLFEGDPDRDVRRRAFEALSLMPEPGQKDWFAGFLEDKDARLREFAADAVGRLPASSSAKRALDSAASDQDEKLRTLHGDEKDVRVRLALAFALTAHGHGEFLGELMDSLDSKFHRDYGKAYLLELGRDASRLSTFYPFLRSEKADVRRYLCEVFETLANPAALPEVRPLMKDSNNDVVTAAIRAVQAMERAK